MTKAALRNSSRTVLEEVVEPVLELKLACSRTYMFLKYSSKTSMLMNWKFSNIQVLEQIQEFGGSRSGDL